jgi:hypothetical protein
MNIQTSEKAVLKALSEAVKTIGTIQEGVHSVLLESSRHMMIFGDTSIVAKVLNGLNEVKGFARVEACAYWFKHIAGVNPKFSDKIGKWEVGARAFEEYQSSLGVKFTYDKHHLSACKLPANRFWLIGGVEAKPLKPLDDITKSTTGVEAVLARALLVGTITQDEVVAHLSTMLARIEAAKYSKSTKAWISLYHAQNQIEVEPTSEEREEAELAELLELDRVAGLEA